LRRRLIAEVFETEERASLRPLPKHPFDTARVVYRLCSIEGFIHCDGNRYSVRYEHVPALLAVRITQNELFVYGPDLACIAHHQRLPRGKGGHIVLAAHRPPRLDSRREAGLRGTMRAVEVDGSFISRPASLRLARRADSRISA
jgi:hypothetical protein